MRLCFYFTFILIYLLFICINEQIKFIFWTLKLYMCKNLFYNNSLTMYRD